MINNVIISGYVDYIYELQDDKFLGTVKVNDDRFYIVGVKEQISTTNIEKKYVIIRGSMVNLKVSLDINNKRIVAIEIRSIEIYDI